MRALVKLHEQAAAAGIVIDDKDFVADVIFPALPLNRIHISKWRHADFIEEDGHPWVVTVFMIEGTGVRLVDGRMPGGVELPVRTSNLVGVVNPRRARLATQRGLLGSRRLGQ
jgi:hypothetical protein